MFGIRPEDEMSWKTYAGAAILFKIACFFLLYLILRLQGILPLNPQGFPGRLAGSGLQYSGQFHYEYQLAGLWR